MDDCSIEIKQDVNCDEPSVVADNTVLNMLSNKLFRVLETKLNSALLFNSEASVSVVWKQSSYVNNVKVGQIVKPVFSSTPRCVDGHIEIDRLSIYTFPNADANLFELIPFDWLKDREMVKRAFNILSGLPKSHRYLFNAIFWDANRFERFCKQPSSMNGHHSELNGNLRHTIEVAEEMRNLCLTRSYANKDLGVLAAFLHDCGKADEYMPNAKGGWDLTDRGKLLGHKVSAVELIVGAVTRWNIQLPQDHYEGLLHMMTAVPHAPEWMGLRPPQTPESLLLSMADRLSGHDDLMLQTVSPTGGFGRYHKHLSGVPFKVRG